MGAKTEERNPHVKISIRSERVPIADATISYDGYRFTCSGKYAPDAGAVYYCILSMATFAHDMFISSGIKDPDLRFALEMVIGQFGVWSKEGPNPIDDLNLPY